MKCCKSSVRAPRSLDEQREMCAAPIGVFLDVNFKFDFREGLKQHIDGSPSIQFNHSVRLLQVPKLPLCKFQLLALFLHDSLNLPGFKTRLQESGNFPLLRLRDTSVKWMSCHSGEGFVVMLVAIGSKWLGAVCNGGGECQWERFEFLGKFIQPWCVALPFASGLTPFKGQIISALPFAFLHLVSSTSPWRFRSTPLRSHL